MKVRSIAASVFLLAACGDADEESAPAGDGPPGAAEGQFFVHEAIYGEDLSARAEAIGTIVDAPADFYQLAASEGACRAFRHEPVFCDGCVGVCNADHECEPFPTALAVGAVHIEGASVAFSLTEEWSYRPSQPLPAELFAAGEAVTLEADGSDQVPAFTLAAAGTDPIWIDLAEGEDIETGEPPGQNSLYLDDTRDLVLDWEGAVADARVRLELRGRNDNHGQPLDGLVVCEADDTGRLTVPRAILEAFPPHPYEATCDARDCPLSTLIRFTRDRVEVGGRVMELEVGARRDFVSVH